MAAAPNQDLTLDLALYWIGVNNANQQEAVCNNLFTTLDEVADVDPKDIDKVAASFAKQPPGSRIIFGHRCTKFLKLFIHWAQDFERVSEDVEYTG